MYRFFDRSRENLTRGARDYGRDSLGLRDGSEMVVSDACVKGKELKLIKELRGWNRRVCKFPVYCLCLSCFSLSHVA